PAAVAALSPPARGARIWYHPRSVRPLSRPRRRRAGSRRQCDARLLLATPLSPARRRDTVAAGQDSSFEPQGGAAMSVSLQSSMPEYLIRGHRVIKELHSEHQHIVIAETLEHGR